MMAAALHPAQVRFYKNHAKIIELKLHFRFRVKMRLDLDVEFLWHKDTVAIKAQAFQENSPL